MRWDEQKRDLGQRIVRIRKRKGWKQTELARRLEVTRERRGRWERGGRAPSLEDLAAFGKKHVGTDGAKQAGDYLVSRFRQLGLADVHTESFQFPRWDLMSSSLTVASPCAASARNSRLPSAPVSGDAISARMPSP